MVCIIPCRGGIGLRCKNITHIHKKNLRVADFLGGKSEIKGLDGERKALVYDNYSKLISATDTIRKVRMKRGGEGSNSFNHGQIWRVGEIYMYKRNKW